MGTGRLEAFSDGVLAIIITIMVLELRVPHGTDLAALRPLVTAWMGENHFASTPTALYGVVLLMAAVAYWILQRQILSAEGPHAVLALAVGRDIKGKLSPLLYALAIGAAFVRPGIADVLYVLVALMWLIPDRRIERALIQVEPGRRDAPGAA
jgi:uncharacterized membrane protein